MSQFHPRRSRNAIDQSQTDIAAAMERALRSFAPNHLKRLVLVSDGNENSGDLAAVIPRLKKEGVEVFTVPQPVRSDQDVWIETLMAPPQVNAEEQFPLEVHIYSPSDMTSTVEIRNGTKVLASRSVPLKKGLNRVAFETSVAEKAGTCCAGSHRARQRRSVSRTTMSFASRWS